jgi:hypothetical protein
MAAKQYPIMTSSGSAVIAETPQKQEVVSTAYIAGTGTMKAPTATARSSGYVTT